LLSVSCPACGASLADSQGNPAAPLISGPPELPFFEIFWGIVSAPLVTFNRVLQGPRGRHAWAMCFLTGFISGLLDFVQKGEHWSLLLFPLWAVVGYGMLWLCAWVYAVTGKWLGGTGKSPELFDYCIWLQVPNVFYRVAGIIRYLLHFSVWQFAWGAMQIVIGIWGIVIAILILAAVNKYSIGKAILNEILFLILLLTPLAFALYLVMKFPMPPIHG
jgi:hypothetical protein